MPSGKAFRVQPKLSANGLSYSDHIYESNGRTQTQTKETEKGEKQVTAGRCSCQVGTAIALILPVLPEGTQMEYAHIFLLSAVG